jgi:Holliday junction resolvasome RuvABC endonuclease subunit
MKQAPEIVIGIDPGRNLGWAVGNMVDGSLMDMGMSRPESDIFYDQVSYMHRHLPAILSKTYKPKLVVVEAVGPIRQPNAAANFWLSYSRGLVIAVANSYDIPILEVYPATLKKFIRERLTEEEIQKYAGNRGSVKKQASVVLANRFFGLNLLMKDHNVADAVCFVAYGLEHAKEKPRCRGV